MASQQIRPILRSPLRICIPNTHLSTGPGYHWFTVAYSIRRRSGLERPDAGVDMADADGGGLAAQRSSLAEVVRGHSTDDETRPQGLMDEDVDEEWQIANQLLAEHECADWDMNDEDVHDEDMVDGW